MENVKILTEVCNYMLMALDENITIEDIKKSLLIKEKELKKKITISNFKQIEQNYDFEIPLFMINEQLNRIDNTTSIINFKFETKKELIICCKKCLECMLKGGLV